MAIEDTKFFAQLRQHCEDNQLAAEKLTVADLAELAGPTLAGQVGYLTNVRNHVAMAIERQQAEAVGRELESAVHTVAADAAVQWTGNRQYVIYLDGLPAEPQPDGNLELGDGR